MSELMIVVWTLLVSLSVAFLLGLALGFFKKMFHVPVDKKVISIRQVLPGANCGACGYPGCDGFAAGVACGDAPVGGCPVGGAPVAKLVGEIMGISGTAEKQVSMLLCQGTRDVCKDKGAYVGIRTCEAAKISINGTKNCDWGCIGFGDCEHACPFDAIHVMEDGLPFVDVEKCTGCTLCVAACPQHILTMVPKSRVGSIALCSCRNPKKGVIMKNCKRGCIKCLRCEKACPNEAIKVTNGIPVVNLDLCESCGKCVSVCPTKVLVLSQDKLVVRSESPCAACTATA